MEKEADGTYIIRTYFTKYNVNTIKKQKVTKYEYYRYFFWLLSKERQ